MGKMKSCNGCPFKDKPDTCETEYLMEHKEPCGSPDSIMGILEAFVLGKDRESAIKLMEQTNNPLIQDISSQVVRTFGQLVYIGYKRKRPMPFKLRGKDLEEYVHMAFYFAMMQGAIYALACITSDDGEHSDIKVTQ